MNGPVDMSPEHLKVVEEILHKNLPSGVAVWVFGSRVSWTTSDSSDLDLALEGDIDNDTILALEMAFEESSLPYTVDIIDLDQVSDNFRRIVDAQKVIFPIIKDRSNTENNWHMASLKEVVDLRISGVDKKTKNGEQPVRLCNYTDVYNNSFINADIDFMTATATEHEIFKCLLSDGDVIITKDSEKYNDIGVPALVRGDIPNLVCGYHLAILRPTSKIDGAYLYYALNTDKARYQFQSYTNGITRFGLRKADIGLVEIPLPSLDEQRSIAHILRTLDEKIDLNRRMSQTLEEIARALFKSWFVDFDPVRAKMDGLWLPGEHFLGAPDNLYDLFPNSLVDSELGEIPKGWEVKELGEIAEQHRFSAKPIEIEPNTPYIALEHMPKHHIALSDWKTSENLASNKYRFKRGDILFGKLRPYFHKVGVAPLAGVCSTDIVVISPLSQDWFGLILCHVSSSEFIDYTESVSIGTKMPRTNWTDMSRYKITFPRRELSKVFTELIQLYVDKIILTTHNSHTLTTMRDALLPMLISGELCTSRRSCRRSVSK